MNVRQLNEDELYELKDTLYTDFYYNKDALPTMLESERKVIERAGYPSDIPDWIMYKLYDGTDFVEDDFFCNI